MYSSVSFFACPLGRFKSLVDNYTHLPTFSGGSGNLCLFTWMFCLTECLNFSQDGDELLNLQYNQWLYGIKIDL